MWKVDESEGADVAAKRAEWLLSRVRSASGGAAAGAGADATPPAAYYIINGGGSGFFRVDYDDANWTRLVEALRATATPAVGADVPPCECFLGECAVAPAGGGALLTAAERVALLGDALALGAAGQRPATLFLRLALAALAPRDGASERGSAIDAIVGRSVVGGLSALIGLFGRAVPGFTARVLVALQPLARALDVGSLLRAPSAAVDGDAADGGGASVTEKQLRLDVLNLLLSCGDAALVGRVRAIFARVAAAGDGALAAFRACASPDVRGLVLRVAAKGGAPDVESAAQSRAAAAAPAAGASSWAGGNWLGDALAHAEAPHLLDADAAFDAIVALYQASDDAGERQQLLGAVGRGADGSGSETLAQRALAFCLSDSVRTQDIVYAIASLCATRNGAAAVWTTLSEKWGTMQGRVRCVRCSCGGEAPEAQARLARSPRFASVADR